MIKNIIFDFGDIFINLDKAATYRELSKRGICHINDEMILLYHQYETGAISTRDFVNYFHKKFELQKRALINAWNAVLLDFPEQRLSFLQNLAASKKYRLFLLSNTNDLHIKWVQNSVGAIFFGQFKNCFEQFYLSHEIHLRKPERDIFEFVLHQNNLNAHETLFVDDLRENTDAAKELGIHVWNLDPESEDVTQLFEKVKLN